MRIQSIKAIFGAIALLLSLAANAQNWGSPVLTEIPGGTGGATGYYPSLLIVNGNPAMAYYDQTHTSLMYMRATDVSGTAWGTPIMVEAAGNVGSYPSLQIVNGNPAISYYDATNGNLKYVRATDVSGSTWGTPISIDVTGDVGLYTSMKVANGNPAIAYYDGTNANLKYVRATDASGTGWSAPINIDVTGVVGQYTCLQILGSGRPAISYYDASNSALKYVYATNLDGTFAGNWNTPGFLDTPGDVGRYSSLQVVSGFPAVSYYDVTNGDLKYMRGSDGFGTVWGAAVTIDATGDVGQYTSMQIVSGNPAISYYDVTNGDLKYMRSSDVSGTVWTSPSAIDLTGDVGRFTCMQIVNSNPAIVYYDFTNGNLKYARATSASSSAWATPLAIDAAGSVGQYTSLQTVNGNPAVSYYDATNLDLKYMRATDVNGTTWAAAIAIDATGDVGQYTSMLTVNGNPAIAYYDVTNGNLKYVRATDASGTAWAAPVSIDVTGNVGQYTSLQIVNGNPAIAYYDAGGGNLKYVRATDTDGNTWGTPVTIDVTGSVGLYASLVVVSGNPAISYHDITTFDLKYVRATDASGTAWGTPISIDVTGSVGSMNSLQVVNGNPAISYYDLTNGNLKYVRSFDATGTSWFAPVALDVTGTVGYYTSLQIVNGNPAISYYDQTNADLKYMRATDASGTTWAAPVSIDLTNDVGRYTSLQIVNGNPAIAYQDFTNGDLKYVRASNADGLAWAAAPLSFDATGTVGDHTSFKIVNSNPSLSYYDIMNGDLKYVRATDASGTTWGTPLAVDASGNVGQYTSLQVVNSNPAISYYDVANGDLKYVRSSDASGTTWSTPVSVDVTGTTGQYTSLQIVNGNPAISYFDFSNANLKYARATDASGTTWAAPITMDAAGAVGYYTSMQIVNGNPAISYYDLTNGDLRYIRAVDANGAGWGSIISVDVTGDVGKYSSLQVVNGNPAIAYYDATNLDLKFVRATDASGAIWGAPVSIDVTGDVGQYVSLQIINGNPAISYYDVTNQDLKYVRASDASGAGWGNSPVTLDAPNNTGQYTSMAPMGTGAGIAYYNVSEGFPYFILGTTPCNNPTVPTLSATSGTLCAGNTTTLSIASGTLNDATNWQWYSASCGGTSVGTGTAVVVSPTTTTTYFARGEGGCVTPGACASLTITVNPKPTVVTNDPAAVCAPSTVNLTAAAVTAGSTAGLTFTYFTDAAATQTYTTPATATGGTYYIVGTVPATGCKDTTAVTATVNPALPVSVNIVGTTTICAGTNVTFTATPTNGGSSPAYQWKVNGGNVGTNSTTYSNATLVNSDLVTCVLTSNATCATGNPATSNTLTMTVNPNLPVSITIAGTTTICAGTNATFTATPTNGGSTPAYQWKVNGANVGTNSANYSSTTLAQSDLVSCVLTSNATCAMGSPATSNTLVITVNPNLPVSVSVAGNTTVCTGTNVTFTASPTNGGSSPAYQWKVNGGNVGTNSTTYSNASLSNNDLVTCVLTSNAACATGNPATSNTLTMTVNPNLPVSVSVAGTTTICAGTNVTFTATPTNGGSSPAYQWKVNGGNVGTNSTTYSSAALSNNDLVTCVLTSNATCATGNPATSNTLTMSVNPNLPVSVSVVGTTTICAGTSVTFTATPTNGGSGPAYQWKLNGGNVGANSTTYSNASLSNADLVSCVLTSNATCATGNPATSNTLTMTVNAIPSVTISGTTTICNGASTVLTASGAASYTWAGGPVAASHTVSPTMNTTYSVTGSTSGCNSTATQLVTVNSLPNVTISGTTTICNGQSTTLTANGADTYVWTGGPGTAANTVSPTSNTTYTVTGTSTATGCSNINMQTVTVNNLPVVNTSGTVANPTGCGATDGSVTGFSVSGTPTLQYSWNGAPNQPNADITNIGAGAYSLIITDGNNCTLNAGTFVLTDPGAPAAPTFTVSSNPVCEGGSFTLMINSPNGSATYSWTGPSGAIGTGTVITINNATVAQENGNYTAQINLSGCTNSSAPLTVTVNPLPSVIISGASSVCNGSSTVLTASGADTFTWTSGPTSASNIVSPTSNTTYTVTGTEIATGCSTSAMHLVTVLATSASSQTVTLCAGQSITVGANTYTATGVYVDVLIAQNGCDSTVTTDLTVNGAVNVSTSTVGNVITANAGSATYQWIDCNNGGAPIAGETSASYTAGTNGDYAVIVTVGTCSDTSACVNINATGIKSNLSQIVTVFPNPSAGIFTILLNQGVGSYLVMDIKGSVVLKGDLSGNKTTLNLSEMENGIYVLNVANRFIKLVKQQ